MSQEKAKTTGRRPAKETLIEVATRLFRTQGYDATSIDDICRAAGVTKGALFHHFASKQAIAAACLEAWDEMTTTMICSAPFNAIADPVERVLGCIDFFAATLSDPDMIKSCLAGTIVQEVSESHPELRDAAGQCLVNAEHQFQSLLDEACVATGRQLDTASLARLWSASLQGSLLLYKASQDDRVFAENLGHVRDYIETLLTGQE